MDFVEIDVLCKEDLKDILTAELCQMRYESFLRLQMDSRRTNSSGIVKKCEASTFKIKEQTEEIQWACLLLEKN